MSVSVVPFQVTEIGRLLACIGIGDGTAATWVVTNWGNMACSCLCSCCHHGQQSCGCIVGLIFILSVSGSVELSVADSIKLREGLLAVVAVGEMSCGITDCLSCRGKQSTLLLILLLSSSGRLLSILLHADCFVSVLFVVRLCGACVGLCVMAGRENEYHGCSCSCWGVSCCNTGCVA